MRVLQAFTRERAARENFRQVSEAYRQRNQETVVQNAVYFPFVDLLSSLATAIILGYGAYLVFDGQTTIGVLTAFLGYVTTFFDPVQQLSQLYSTFLSAVAALDKIMEVLEEEPQVTDAPGARRAPRVRGHVRFDDVHFTYGTGPGGAARDRPRRPGRHDRRARRPHRRRQVDDREADRALLRPDRGARSRSTASTSARSRQESLRRQLGIVPQEGFLFAGTVAENIAFGRPGGDPRGDRRRRARRRRRRVHRRGSRTATTPRSASAASGSRSASASSSRSRARCSPTRRS